MAQAPVFVAGVRAPMRRGLVLLRPPTIRIMHRDQQRCVRRAPPRGVAQYERLRALGRRARRPAPAFTAHVDEGRVPVAHLPVARLQPLQAPCADAVHALAEGQHEVRRGGRHRAAGDEGQRDVRVEVRRAGVDVPDVVGHEDEQVEVALRRRGVCIGEEVRVQQRFDEPEGAQLAVVVLATAGDFDEFPYMRRGKNCIDDVVFCTAVPRGSEK